MAKVTIKGEVFSFDPRFPLGDAIAVEKALGITFEAWRESFAGGGSAEALAAFAWLVLRQNGRTEPALADILSGAYELYPDQIEIHAEDGEPGPTGGASGAPPGLSASGGSGSGPSPSGSGTPPPSSTPSPSTSSTT